jgi:hypothetical protein
MAMLGDNARPTVQVATAGWAFQEGIRSLFSGAGTVSMLLLLVLAAAGAAALWRRHPFATALLVAPGVVTGLAVLASAEPLRPRFFFFLSGAAAIFAARGIGATAHVITRRDERSLTAATALCTLALVGLSATALPRNYRIPKQDFDGAVRYLEVAESHGRRIAVAGPACPLVDSYFGKPWHCIESLDDWRTASDTGAAEPLLIMYTLAEYSDDRDVLRNLQTRCPEVRRFPGTLGGGDLVVCEAAGQPGS